MSMNLLALLGGGLLGGIGNIAGGLLADGDSGQLDLNELYRNLFNYQADPNYNASTTQILAMLGAPDTTSTTQATPFAQVMNTLNSQGLFREEDARDVRQAATVAQTVINQYTGNGVTDPNVIWDAIANNLRSAYGGNGERVLNQLITAIGSSGFTSPQDLVTRQQGYQKQAAELQSQLDSVRGDVQKGRVSALQNISRILQDFPAYTKSDIERLSEVERGRSRDAVLQAANVGGFNPAGGLSEVERDPNPIARAVALLGGAQNLATNSLSTLNASLLDPIQASQAQAQIGLNAALGSMSTAAQQALAYAGLQAQNNQNSGALGSGVAAGLGGLGSSLSLLALKDMFGDDKEEQPGTSQNNTQPAGSYRFSSYGGFF